MRSINAILKGKKLDKKLEKLISINSELSCNLSDPNQSTSKQYLAIGALVESLVTVAKGTRFESEVNEIMDACEKYLYKD